MSDLHLEYDAKYVEQNKHIPDGRDFYTCPPQSKADVLVLAGDIHSGSAAFEWARSHFSIPTILIGGNHEPYGRELFRTVAIARQRANNSNGRIIYLENDAWYYISPRREIIRFIGATLWTDFCLNHTHAASMTIAEQRLDDFKIITIEEGDQWRPLRAADTTKLHCNPLAFLRQELTHPFDGTTVVITHHAPSPRSVAPRFKQDPLNPAFVSNLDSLIADTQPSLWIHGHMHNSFDYMMGRTRIVCNPRGYFPDELNPQFDPTLVIEIER